MKVAEAARTLDLIDDVASGDGLSIDAIRRRLVTDRVAFQTYLFGEVSSTNEVLRQLAETGAADGTVVLADQQTMGRGRLGKVWFSPPGVNLYASVLFRPRIAPAGVPVFAFIASLAITDAVRAEGVRADIKWPNDVIVDGRKAGGTLVHYASAGDQIAYVILGVGMNLNVDRATLRTELGPLAADATSLSAAAGRLIDRNRFAAAFLNLLERWHDAYRVHGPDAIVTAWRARDALAGRAVEVRGQDATFRGIAHGIDPDGRLVVDDADGARRLVATGEVVRLDRGDRR